MRRSGAKRSAASVVRVNEAMVPGGTGDTLAPTARETVGEGAAAAALTQKRLYDGEKAEENFALVSGDCVRVRQEWQFLG